MMNTRILLTALALLASTASLMAQTIDIFYSGNTANVTIPADVTDVEVTKNGAHVTITSSTTSTEYTYHVTGKTVDGSLTINGSYKLTLQLDGVNIKSTKGAAIDIECGKRTAVELMPGTVSTLSDCTGGSQKAALYFSGHPEFEGSGILNVKGNSKHAICAKEYIQMKKSLGTINVLGAASDGIHCGKGKVSEWDDNMILNENELFICDGGIINISNTGSDCIDAGDYGSMYIKGGHLNLDVSSSNASALKCINTFILDGGALNIDINGTTSEGIYVNNEAQFKSGEIYIDITGNGSKGIKGKQKSSTPYTNGGNAQFCGASVTIIARGSDFVADSDTTHCVGISIDGNLTQTQGDISVTTVGTEARSVTCDGTLKGSFNTYATMWYANPYQYRYSMMTYANIYINDDNISASDLYAIGAFAGDECRGTYQHSGSSYGYFRIYSNAENEDITFKVYNKETGELLSPDYTLAFASDNTIGSPSSPIVITVQTQTEEPEPEPIVITTIPIASSLADDGNTVQYLYNVEAAGFFIGANEWETRASIAGMHGYKFMVANNGNGTWTLNDFVENHGKWESVFADNESGIWVDNVNGANVHEWVVKANGDGTYCIENPRASAGRLAAKDIRGNDTRLYLTSSESAYYKWIFVSEKDYQMYISNPPSAEVLEAYKDSIESEKDKVIEGEIKKQLEMVANAVANATSTVDLTDIVGIKTNAMDGWAIDNGSTFHLNTWSVEGNEGEDPSGMVTPFIENWVAGGSILSEANITYKELYVPAGTYEVSALMRAYNEANQIVPTNAYLFLNNAQSSDISSGTTFEYHGMAGVYGIYTARIELKEDGIIQIGIHLDGGTFNWIAFKDVKLKYLVENLDIQNTQENHDAVPASIYTISGSKTNSLQRGINIIRMSDGSTKKIFIK